MRRRRHEKLALDLRTQLGGMDGRLTSAEGHAASYLGAVDALQMQASIRCRDRLVIPFSLALPARVRI